MKLFYSYWIFLVVLFTSVSAFAGETLLEEKLDAAFKQKDLTGLHSVYILHKGEVLAERYYSGQDQRWGDPLGQVKQSASQLHDLRSVSKSITSLLYGIALEEGIVPDLDAVVVDQFPKYDDLLNDPERRKIIIRDILSMKMGTEWDENLPYSDPRNSEIAMENSADRYRFILDRPMVSTPGEQWTYNGGATALIAGLISRGAGKSIDVYAKEKLFAPLGIADFEWIGGREGVPSAASGLRLNIHDLAKIGSMIVDNGNWQGKPIVSSDWLEKSFVPRANLPMGLRYGYFWWLSPNGSPPHWVAGFGNGGQRLVVDQTNQLVIVIFAGNYNQRNAWQLPVKIITEFVLPTVFQK
ncbi:MAG: serine hydrolase [Halopseudomonas aestusnigri]